MSKQADGVKRPHKSNISLDVHKWLSSFYNHDSINLGGANGHSSVPLVMWGACLVSEKQILRRTINGLQVVEGGCGGKVSKDAVQHYWKRENKDRCALKLYSWRGGLLMQLYHFLHQPG